MGGPTANRRLIALRLDDDSEARTEPAFIEPMQCKPVLASLEGDFIFDGELLALDFQGRPSFQMLQVAPSQSLSIHFYAFYLLN
jgi:ATP-dependent DNA ligase